jgi:hypothetical protein
VAAPFTGASLCLSLFFARRRKSKFKDETTSQFTAEIQREDGARKGRRYKTSIASRAIV